MNKEDSNSIITEETGIHILDIIDLSCLKDKELIESDEFIYSPKSHPLFRIM